jgi:hypothetical protein
MKSEEDEREAMLIAIREDRCPDCGHVGFDDHHSRCVMTSTKQQFIYGDKAW